MAAAGVVEENTTAVCLVARGLLPGDVSKLELKASEKRFQLLSRDVASASAAAVDCKSGSQTRDRVETILVFFETLQMVMRTRTKVEVGHPES